MRDKALRTVLNVYIQKEMYWKILWSPNYNPSYVVNITLDIFFI
jgi:hypothetical protein